MIIRVLFYQIGTSLKGAVFGGFMVTTKPVNIVKARLTCVGFHCRSTLPLWELKFVMVLKMLFYVIVLEHVWYSNSRTTSKKLQCYAQGLDDLGVTMIGTDCQVFGIHYTCPTSQMQQAGIHTGLYWELNQGPFALQSKTLTIRPHCSSNF